jgi:Gram-negative bacterial TonB protein C-terminal
MLADVIINPGTKHEQHGQLRFSREKDRSRVDLQVGDYHETQVTIQNKLYVYRSSRRPVSVPSRLLGIERLWKVELTPTMKLGAIKHKNRDHIPAECFSIKDPQYHDFETRYCVSAEDKTLVEVSTEYEKTTLANFIKLADGSLPSLITYKTDDSAKQIVIRQIELTPLRPKDDTFAVPEHAREFETCDYVEGGNFLKKVEPVYPRSAGSGAATIYFRGIVQKDGSFTDIDVFSPDGPEFEKAGLAAAVQWRFSPPMCNGHPIAAEDETTITLQRH